MPISIRNCSYVSNTFHDNIKEPLNTPINLKRSFIFDPKRMQKTTNASTQKAFHTPQNDSIYSSQSHDEFTHHKMWNLPVDNEEVKNVIQFMIYFLFSSIVPRRF